MLASMTAFQRTMNTGPWGSATLELKTVNHRYLDINIRLPDYLRMLEPIFREQIKKKINRGKVDGILRVELDSIDEVNLEINSELAKKLINAAMSLPLEEPKTINPVDILKWPDVVNMEKPNIDILTGPICMLLTKTLDQLVEVRHREGQNIRKILLARHKSMALHIKQTREKLPKIISSLRDLYRQKAAEISSELDNDRLEQEILYMVQKMDIAEELDRLDIHLAEMKRVLDLDEPTGRRLDFLLQEMNREANTIASKSINIDTSNSSVELKVLIEQVREQIQNIE